MPCGAGGADPGRDPPERPARAAATRHAMKNRAQHRLAEGPDGNGGRFSGLRHAFAATDRYGAGLVFLAFLALQLLVWRDYRRSPFYEGLICDAKYYAEWARALLVTGGISRGVFYQAPLYPYFLWALWTATAPVPVAAYLAQMLLNAGSAALVFSMGRVLGGRSAGWLAAGLVIVYGPLSFYALKLLGETLAVFLCVLLACLISGPPARGRLAAAGAACGLLALAKPQALLLAPPLCLAAVVRVPGGWRARLAAGVCFALPLLLLVGLTAAHNWAAEGRLVPVAANGGANFYIGNHSDADGVYRHVDGLAPGIERQAECGRASAERDAGRPLAAADVSAFWFRKGLAFIRADPADFLRLEWLKLCRLLAATEYSSMYYLSFERRELTPALRWVPLGFPLLWALAAAGLAALCVCRRPRRRGSGAVALVSVILVAGWAANVLIFFADERFRLPMAPFLALLAAAGWVRGARAIRDRSRAPAGRAGLAALMLLAAGGAWAATRLDPGRSSVDPILRLFLGDIHYQAGDYPRALEEYAHASRLRAPHWEAAMEVAKVLYALGRRDPALAIYRQAWPNLSPLIAAEYDRSKDFAGLRKLDAMTLAADPAAAGTGGPAASERSNPVDLGTATR